MPEESKDEDVIDTSDENLEEAKYNILKLLEEYKTNHMVYLN